MVLLSHPTGNANTRQALLAFRERNLLDAFYTTVAWDSAATWNKLLPASVSKELTRRGYPGIPERLIHTAPAREMCRVLFARLGMKTLVNRRHSPFSIESIYEHCDRMAAKAVQSRLPHAVYAYDGGALETFRIARKLGVKTIYELPIAHWKARRALLEEEARLQPEYAGVIRDTADSQEWVWRKDKELELSDQIIVPSGYVQSTLPANVPASKVTVVPYGAPIVADNQAPRKSSKGRKLRVLYVGGLTQRKGFSYLLDAVKKVQSAVEFTIIGSRVGDCKPIDAALNQYRWMATVPHSEVLEAMSDHDVFAFPTLSEGFALVILEAMSRGMVVVTTPNSGGLEVIRDGKDGYVIPIRSSEAMAEKLELLDRDRDLLQTISAAALQRAQECTWERYRQLLAAAVENSCGEFSRV